ncbi:MAG: flavin reductase [Desulfosporosinus sp. BRH_c37]|nr:MAG: flavin reductase [Desulfosporosinus sp. BRH_c37]
MDLFPVPTVLVTSQNEGSNPNIITIAWTGVLASGPQLVVYISMRPSRYSHQLITQSMEYVINIPSAEQAQIVDYCGLVSGKDVDKFQITGLTPLEASQVKAPLIAECPVNLECRVRQIVSLGTHDIFIADVLAVHYNNEVLDERGKPDLDKIKPIAFCSNEYRLLSNQIGTLGYSNKLQK